MKLDSEKKVLLCQKALYSKQLAHYRNLCAIYRELATYTVRKLNMQDKPDATVADQLQDFYGPYLSRVSRGDLSFLNSNISISSGVPRAKFDQEQIRLFKQYSNASERVATFQKASSLLQDATYEGKNFDIDPQLLDDHNFMQGDKETQSFDNFIAENSKRWIGHVSFRRSINEINKIREIDANHVAILSGRSLTPQSFGSTITGYRGKIRSEKDRMTQDVMADLSEKDIEKFKQPISNIEKVGEAAFVLSHRAKESTKEFYHSHKGTIQKALKKAALIGLALGMVYAGSKGVEKIIDAHEFNTEAYMGNPAYEQSVDDETIQMMQDVDEFLTSLETSSSIPTEEQLRQATEMVDNEGNIIMDNLIRNSFENQFENLTIPENGVVIHYNKNHDSLSDGSLGNYVYITCQDENGKEYRYTITDFRSQGENRIKRLFTDERNIDEQRKDIEDVYNDNFTMNSKNAREYLADLREMHNNNVELAGSVIIIESPQINYDNAKVTDSETLGDKFNLEFAKLFCIDTRIRTVSPERVEEEKTSTLTVETINTSSTTPEHEIDDGDER